MMIIKNSYIFALTLLKQFFILFVNNGKLDSTYSKIIYLPGLHLCSTLGRFSLFKWLVYGI